MYTTTITIITDARDAADAARDVEQMVDFARREVTTHGLVWSQTPKHTFVVGETVEQVTETAQV